MMMANSSNNKRDAVLLFFGLMSFSLLALTHGSYPYYGTKIGALSRLHHGVSGDVYAVDSRTIFIKKFNYDGEAPAAYFYVGNTDKPSNEGALRVRDERGGTTSLTRRYRNKDITLSLPEGKTLRDIKWFSVWCDEFAVNFGDVAIPNNLDFPRPQRINALKGVHGVGSDNIVIVDAQTLLVPNFSYDGEAPDAKFWVGRGQRPTATGLRIPDENGKENPLRRYERKTIVLTLPEDLTIFDIGHFGVWCEAFAVDFGHVRIPEGLNVPPSLKMLGISPQSKLNCEVLYDDLAFEVRWAVAGESIVVQLVAKLAPNEYMSFGVSRSNHTEMIGADVVVAWVDKDTGKGYAQDYFLDDKSQCSGERGTCPDVNIKDNTNSIRLLNAAMVNGYSIVTYQRALQATDYLDLPILVNDSQAIIWAVGPLNERKEASFHSVFTKRDHFINFGRQPSWNCPMPEGTKPVGSSDEPDEDDTEEPPRDVSVNGYPPARSANSGNSEPEEEFYENRAQALQGPVPNRRQGSGSSNSVSQQRQRTVPTPKPVNTNGAWDIPPIQCYEPEDGVFYAQMGPTGGKHGYPAITGHVGWGISWYINGLLIPEIHVVRGKTYTFVVEGGNNPDVPAKYHPFYITDDPVGGYEHKREEEKKAVRIFAGVHRSRSGQMTPTGVGRLCNWTPDVDGPPADDYQSFGAYQRTLTLKCDAGEPGVITWKPDRNTPDTVYYHCFTHRYLGWKIHVHDSCDDPRFSASENHEVRVPASPEASEDYLAESSIRHETKVSPNDNFLLKHQTDLIKNHNMNGTPPKLSFEITKSSEITKLISDGIRAAEALEESLLRNEAPSLNNNYNNNNNYNSNGALLQGGGSSVSQSGPFNSPVKHINSVNAGKIPANPHISVTKPEILHGETHTLHTQNHPQTNSHAKLPIFAAPQSSHALNTNHLHSHHLLSHQRHHHPLNNLTNLPAQSQKTISLSEYLRPPQNAPLFHPVKLPNRRPYLGPVKKVPAGRPVLPQHTPPRHSPPPPGVGLVPQPSLIVSHYRKPVPGLLKPFFKEKPFPIQPIAASVLLLGQPTELGGQRKSDPHLHIKKKPPIMSVPVPYSDLDQQSSIQNNAFLNAMNIIKEKKPIYHTPKLPISTVGLPLHTTPAVIAPIYKKPFDVHEVVEEPSVKELATMKPAVNQGFKPDSVVVESGFRPIIRQDGSGVQLPPEVVVDQVAHRREDPGTEIDEAMETDTLFLTAQQGSETQSFEPMFIPSPLDSTNATIIVRKSSIPVASALRLPSAATTSSVPLAEKLRNPSLEDLLEDDTLLKEDEENEAPTELSQKEAPEAPDTVNELLESHENLPTDYADMDMEDEAFLDEGEGELGEDKVAQAAERVDTYYLPPDNRKIPHANIPSGAVITYDGKSVIDSTLVLPPKLDTPDSVGSSRRQHNFSGLSKLEQLIRTTPQFKTFRGELPPPIPEFPSIQHSHSGQHSSSAVKLANPIYQSSTRAASSSASTALPTQSSSTSLTSTLTTRPISTKLQLLKNNNNNNNNST